MTADASADAAWATLVADVAIDARCLWAEVRVIVHRHRPAIEAAIRGAEAGLDAERLAAHFEDRLVPGVLYTREFIVGAIREYARLADSEPS